MGEFPDSLANYQLHLSDPYATSWSEQRASFLGIGGIPDTYFDGVVHSVGGGTGTLNAYRNLINTRLGVPTDVTIDLQAIEVADLTYDVTMTIAIEPSGEAKDLKFHIVQVLDYYPAASDGRYRNCVVEHQGSGEVPLAPGESTEFTRQFVLSGVSATRVEDVKFIAFAREHGTPGPKEVYQAAVIAYPFTQPVEGDIDGDGDVDLADLAAMLAAYGTCDGDAGYNPDADLDGDDCVGLADLATLLANYGYGT
jgi:hypothetical protein